MADEPTTTDTEETEEGAEESGGKKGKKGKKGKGGKLGKLLPAIIIAVGLIGAAFVFKGCGGSGGAETTATTEPAAVTTTTFAADAPRMNATFEPMTINLAGGRYLRIGLSLAMVQGAEFGDAEHPTVVPEAAAGGGAHGGGGEASPMAPIVEELTPEVSDIVISTLGGGDAAALTTPAGREQARSRLAATFTEEIGTDIKVYFTSFVVA